MRARLLYTLYTKRDEVILNKNDLVSCDFLGCHKGNKSYLIEKNDVRTIVEERDLRFVCRFK